MSFLTIAVVDSSAFAIAGTVRPRARNSSTLDRRAATSALVMTRSSHPAPTATTSAEKHQVAGRAAGTTQVRPVAAQMRPACAVRAGVGGGGTGPGTRATA